MIFSKILVAFDGSELSKKALHIAMNLRNNSPASVLDVIHVFPLPVAIFGEGVVNVSPREEKEQYDTAEAIANQARLELNGIENTSVVLRQGNPSEMISIYAEESGCDLIVLGSRGLGGVREFVLGSVSHNVVQHSQIPVLVIK